MEGTEFQKYFNDFPYLKNHFVGTFAINTIPKTLKNHHFFVFNTDLSNLAGQHWLCCYREAKSLICFDSMGINDEKKMLLKKYCKIKGINEIHFNETQFQSNSSQTCGHFTIFFLIQKSYNKDLTFKDLLEEIFDKNPIANETIVIKFFSEIFENLSN
jgi:hypothetical protein